MIIEFFIDVIGFIIEGDETKPADSRYNRFARWLRYSFSGFLIGFLSFAFYHERLIAHDSVRIMNLFLMPYLCALIVSYIYKYALKNRTLTFSMKHWYVFFFLFLLMQFLPFKAA